ncbi:uncharacterized protein Z520_03529 [Fonsecaea multimorphosa CBS 102226]|uniref:Uncharacterized protein n=1 Tax=Fonsecaea multimorphosa CBS 102226 TaxID=1442371 RepID=A0A0D2K4Y8_9EURO|nr:uncharacterized protein Z520_03529 [Fonsecaea multimorphosa CBS 102226]KIY00863.1 hypothetical protein Z520_03529 [Fonsecaea multimorphosa CBS 102226]OAL27692.1 hypothetical protein AYO22_03358 [Fonsecaea multimorphosa]
MPVSKKDLEPDIQYMVVGVLVAEFEWLSNRIWLQEHVDDKHRVLSTLLSLRLTCQHLGQANIIKAAVFKEVTLQATTLSMNRITNTNLSSIAPFVRKINFLPTPFITNLELGDFTRVLEILSEHESNLPVRSRRHVETQWGAIPRTEARVTIAFNMHLKQALLDQSSIYSGELLCLWTIALRIFQHTTEFELFSIFGRHPLDPSEDSGMTHCPSCLESKNTLYDRTGVSEGQMLKTAIQCLVSSNAQIKSFSLHRTLAQHFKEVPSATWDLLDLSRLETLKYPDLEIVEDEYADDIEERDAAARRCLVRSLEKPLLNLRELNVDHYVEVPRLKLPHLSLIVLPCLRSITLGGVLVRVPRLAHTVTSCVALEDIYLRNCHPMGPDGSVVVDPEDREWEPLFDALSHHPNLGHFTITDQWAFMTSYSLTAMPDINHVEVHRLLLRTDMSAIPEYGYRGIWDAALLVYLGAED